MAAVALQQIIGTDKRNPDFTICREEAKVKTLRVFFGAALLEVVPEDPANPEFKLLIARLYNSRIKVKKLIKVFGIARTTMKRWGDALKSGNSELLAKALAGAGAPQKLTSPVLSFIELRFPEIYHETRYCYSRIMRQEIERVFGIALSGESLRLIFNRLKSTGAAPEANPQARLRANACDLEAPAAEDDRMEQAVDSQEIIKGLPGCSPEPGSEPDRLQSNQPPADNRKHPLPFSTDRQVFCHHAGVVLFSNEINKFSNQIPDALSKQLLATILLGATNIEQTKLLDFSCLMVILGAIIPNLYTQRTKLSAMAEPENIKALLKFNAELAGAGHCRDFYFDPHTKHYTGAEKILKGWCGALKAAAKIVNMDCIHTAPDGQPVFIKHEDNFHDMRERFIKVLAEFRTITGRQDDELSFIMDRGIYSFEFFEAIVNDQNTHIITWEKGYKRDQWDDKEISGQSVLCRCRNNSRDLLKYEFKYIDQQWEKNSALRRILVQATNPNRKMVEVSILTDDKERPAQQIIEHMFSRWVQENDFKYEDAHFGINEITSYASISYRKLKDLSDDKQIKLAQYKALELNARDVRERLKKSLLKQHLVKDRTKTKEMDATIEKLSLEHKEIKQRMAQTRKQGSKLLELIAGEYRKLDTDNKAYLDCIKIIARNMFYKALDSFKKKYDNYRDDHVLFRNLTRSPGVISFTEEGLTVTVFPTAQHQPKVRKIIELVFNEINATKPQLPDGSKRKVKLKLGEKINNVLFAVRAVQKNDQNLD